MNCFLKLGMPMKDWRFFCFRVPSDNFQVSDVKMCVGEWHVKERSHVTSAFASKFNNWLHRNEWRCLHLAFQFLRTQRQTSKENTSADVTCDRFLNDMYVHTARHRPIKWVVKNCVEVFILHRDRDQHRFTSSRVSSCPINPIKSYIFGIVL